MGYETIRFERQQLYERVWATPMTVLAKEFGLSDVGLRKICKKMEIPLPPQGYHLRSHKGKKTPLRPATKAEETYITQVIRNENQIDRENSGQVLPEIAFEKDPKNKITVADRLSLSAHKLVKITKEKIDLRKADTGDRINGGSDGGVAIQVSQSSAIRALCILDALLNALESRRYELCVDKQSRLSHVKVLNHNISLSIVERTKQVPHKPTAEELKQAKKYSWMSYPKYDYVKSGELSIKLAGSGCESVISDTSRRLLESCLNEVIIRMVKLAKRIQNDREEKERREREYEEKKQRRNQIIQQHEDEKAKLEQLYSESKQWQKSQQLRAYIEAVKQAAMKNDGQIEPGSEIDEWIRWAHKQADRLDPFIESPHSILDEKVPSLW